MALGIAKTFAKMILGRGVSKSYAQYGEDLLIRPFVPARGGFYVDVGCYHPMLYSNTYKLYRQGWKGIVIDPNKRLKTLFTIFRPRDTFVHAGVGEAGEREYFEFSDGAYNTFSRTTAEGYKKRTTLERTYPVMIRPLSELLAGVDHIDLLDIDVEGLDLEVLQSYDWRVYPKTIIVEAPLNSPVHEYLVSKGYALAGLTRLNLIFVR